MVDPLTFAKQGSEHAIQTALFMHFALADVRTRYPETLWMFAIPNGGNRDKKSAGAMKAEGVKAGVSDICLPVARRSYHGLFLEMKNAKGKPSDKQLEFSEFARAQGYFVWIINEQTAEACYTTAIKCIEWYLGE